MSESAIVFDCEFLTAPGAPQRFWCGPNDPDPVAVQIGAVKLALTRDADALADWEQVILPPTRNGGTAPLQPFFTKLTGLDEARLARDAVSLADAIDGLDAFSDGASLWSWGKDEFNLLAISCYVAGIPPKIAANRFGNAARLFARAGFADETIHGLRSPGLPAFLGLNAKDLTAHDALGDAKAVALSLQHLIRTGRLDPDALRHPAP
ncbi:MAG: exonuclease [Pseudomonadota bacterium]